MSRSRITRGDILESISDGFCAFDREWRYTYFNAAAEKISGLSRDGRGARFGADGYFRKHRATMVTSKSRRPSKICYWGSRQVKNWLKEVRRRNPEI
jgi:PAS domain-containing protein